MKHQFTHLSKGRALMLKLISGLTIEQLNKTPEGFNNNIAWNIAHLVVTQQLLCYRLSGLPCTVSDEMIDTYKKGTAPNKEVTTEEFEEIKALFVSLPVQFEKDYNAGLFKEYSDYTTSVDVTLTDIESATSFNSFHEGIHLGVLLALRKLV
ncbi:DinB family protein [Bacteroidota bacterium]